MNPEDKQPLMSIGEASDYLGVSIDTLRRWSKIGKIEDFRSPGGHRYYSKEDLDKIFGTRYQRKTETKPREIKEKPQQEVPQPDATQETIQTTQETTPEPITSTPVVDQYQSPPPPVEFTSVYANATDDVPPYTPIAEPTQEETPITTTYTQQTPIQNSETEPTQENKKSILEPDLSERSQQYQESNTSGTLFNTQTPTTTADISQSVPQVQTSTQTPTPSPSTPETTEETEGKSKTIQIFLIATIILILFSIAVVFFITYPSSEIVSPIP